MARTSVGLTSVVDVADAYGASGLGNRLGGRDLEADAALMVGMCRRVEVADRSQSGTTKENEKGR